jgi:uncharacterized membrane protein
MSKKSKKSKNNKLIPHPLSSQIPQQQSPGKPNVRAVLETHIESFSGPIPNPSLLKEYESILPGIAERIFTMAEKQSEHRQSLERIVIGGDSKRADKGLYCGVVVAIGGLIAATILGLNNQVILAGIIGGTPLVGLVGTFIYGTERRRSERESKANKMVDALKPGKSGDKIG